MTDSDPLATDFYSFMEMLGHRTGMVSDVSYKAGSEDISELQVGHFKKWIRLFRTNVSLDQGSGPIQKRLQGLMFWASLRLFLHFKDGVARRFE